MPVDARRITRDVLHRRRRRVEAAIRRNCPVRTGLLRRSIRLRVAALDPTADLPYAYNVVMARYGWPVEHEARFISRAWAREGPHIRAEARREVASAIDVYEQNRRAILRSSWRRLALSAFVVGLDAFRSFLADANRQL